MGHMVCPWWLGHFLACPLRRLIHNPGRILSPLVAAGMTVLEPGPGMGFFTLDLACMVGGTGRIVAVDVQPKMLEALGKKAKKAGLADRIELRLATMGGMGVSDLHGIVDFVLAFGVVHEMPDVDHFFMETAMALKQGGKVLVAEPKGPVTDAAFAETLKKADRAGLRTEGRPAIFSTRSAVLVKV